MADWDAANDTLNSVQFSVTDDIDSSWSLWRTLPLYPAKVHPKQDYCHLQNSSLAYSFNHQAFS